MTNKPPIHECVVFGLAVSLLAVFAIALSPILVPLYLIGRLALWVSAKWADDCMGGES